MKLFEAILIFLPAWGIGQLKVEWHREFPGPIVISGILATDRQLLVATPPVISSLSVAGDLKSEISVGQIYTLDRYYDGIYTVGGAYLSMFDSLGNKLSSVPLYWQGEENISARNGRIMDGFLYTTNYNKDFLKYDFSGNQIFRISVGEVSTNHFLVAGGGSIYLYSSFNSHYDKRLMRYDSLGNQKWSMMGHFANILCDKAGNVYALCFQPQSNSIVNKYDREGKLIWSQEIPDQAVDHGAIFGDSLFICGIVSIQAASGQPQNAAFSVLSCNSGKVLYQQVLDFYGDGCDEYFNEIATDGKSVYLAGKTVEQTKKCFLVKLSHEGNTTGINNESGSRYFSIFPNPGSVRFTICSENPISGFLRVTVRNVLGQVVHQDELFCEGKKSWELDLGKQASGTYSVEILSGKEKVVKQVIIE